MQLREILDGIARLHSLSSEQRRSHFLAHPYDALSTLPVPGKHGILFCGWEGAKRFSRLASWYLSANKSIARITEHFEFEHHLKREFVRIFLEEGLEPSRVTLKQLLFEATRHSTAGLVTLTHHVPCTLPTMDDPTGFRVGPVWFRPRSGFLRQHSGRMSDGYLVESIIGEEQWVASVRIPKCHQGSSRRHAVRAINGAINILRLLLNQRFAQEFSTVFTSVNPSYVAYIVRDERRGLHQAVSKTYGPPPLETRWHARLRSRGASFYRPATRALRRIVTLDAAYPLCSRFIDAAAWFGDALLEIGHAAQIVKYVSALESMLLTEEGSPAIHLTKRGAAIATIYMEEDPSDFGEDIRELYGLRSDIVHGKCSPASPELLRSVGKAYRVTRQVLLGGLLFLYSLGLERPSIGVRHLRKAYCSLEHRYDQWQAERSQQVTIRGRCGG